MILVVASMTPFLYQVIGDLVEGKWSGGTEIYVHSERLPDNGPVYIFYTSPIVSELTRIIVPVEIKVVNDSKKAAKDVTLSIRYPKSSSRNELSEIAQTFSGSLSAKDVSVETNTDEKFAWANHKIKMMPPEDKINFVDGAFAVPVGNDTPSYKTTGLGLDVKVSLSSETDPAHGVELRYRGIVADSNKVIGSWLAEDYGQYVALDLRQRDGFWKYFWGWVTSEKITVFGFSTEYRLTENNAFIVPVRNPDEYKKYKFSPYVREFLFSR